MGNFAGGTLRGRIFHLVFCTYFSLVSPAILELHSARLCHPISTSCYCHGLYLCLFPCLFLSLFLFVSVFVSLFVSGFISVFVSLPARVFVCFVPSRGGSSRSFSYSVYSLPQFHFAAGCSLITLCFPSPESLFPGSSPFSGHQVLE